MKKKNLLPNIILSVILIGVLIICFSGFLVIEAEGNGAPQDQEQTSLPPVSDSSVVYVEVPLKPSSYVISDTEDLTELKELIKECDARKEAAHNIAQSARALGYEEEDALIQFAKSEWTSADEHQKHYTRVYEKVCDTTWSAHAEEYPIATEIWIYLKGLGYNDYVCAGIMGNIMAEVGGQTLNIQPHLYSSDRAFYGMCQWSKTYASIHGADLNAQCEFLSETIEYEINTFGYAYKRNFDYSAFLALTNERDAALAFAKTYERCAEFSYSIRQKNAAIAYEYFVD